MVGACSRRIADGRLISSGGPRADGHFKARPCALNWPGPRTAEGCMRAVHPSTAPREVNVNYAAVSRSAWSVVSWLRVVSQSVGRGAASSRGRAFAERVLYQKNIFERDFVAPSTDANEPRTTEREKNMAEKNNTRTHATPSTSSNIRSMTSLATPCATRPTAAGRTGRRRLQRGRRSARSRCWRERRPWEE